MNRLERIAKTNSLAGKRVVVTGCGYSPVDVGKMHVTGEPYDHRFKDITTGEYSHDSIEVDGKEMKLNIGSAVAGVLALNGATVHMVSTSPDKLRNIKRGLSEVVGNKSRIKYSALDLLDEGQVSEFTGSLPEDLPIYWVQSVGLGAGSYKLEFDNPYLPLENIPVELLEKESTTVLRATHLMMNGLVEKVHSRRRNLHILGNDESRFAIITSMSAIRGYSLGGTHCAAKGAIDRYANAAMLSLYKNNIFVTSIRPGGVDTGMYDSWPVRGSICKISDEYNGAWRNNITLAPPTSVGEAVNFVFTTPAHIPSLNLVAKGQFPNEGS